MGESQQKNGESPDEGKRIPQEDFDKLKETLNKAREVVKNVKESEGLSAQEKAERLKKAAEILRTNVIGKRLEKWKTLYPAQKEAIDKAVKAVEAEAKKYETEAEAILQSAEQRETVKESEPSLIPGPQATYEAKEFYWKNVLKNRVDRDYWSEDKKLFDAEASKDRAARRLTNSIKILDKDTAEILVKYHPSTEYLCLDGVEELTPGIARILAKSPTAKISLKGLKKLDEESAEILAGYAFRSIPEKHSMGGIWLDQRILLENKAAKEIFSNMADKVEKEESGKRAKDYEKKAKEIEESASVIPEMRLERRYFVGDSTMGWYWEIYIGENKDGIGKLEVGYYTKNLDEAREYRDGWHVYSYSEHEEEEIYGESQDEIAEGLKKLKEQYDKTKGKPKLEQQALEKVNSSLGRDAEPTQTPVPVLEKQSEEILKSAEARKEIKKTIKTPISNPFGGLVAAVKNFHLPEVPSQTQAPQPQPVQESVSIKSEPPPAQESTEVVSQFSEEFNKLSEKMQNGDTGILIDGNGQNLLVVKKENDNFNVVAEYKVSTGKRGFKPSGGNGITPLGLFRIDAMPKGSIGQLIATGSTRSKYFKDLDDASDNHGKAVMTTAALHLEGEEAGKNNRYHDFRIHGTNYESRIGKPASGGCVRTKNSDMLKIYEFAQAQKETGRELYVYITNRNPLEEVRHEYASR